MSQKLSVDLHTYAHATVTVELSDDELRRLASDLDVDIDKLTVDDMRELAIDKAYDKAPSICAQCSGWARDYSLDLGDEWTVTDDDDDKTDDPRSKSVRIITKSESEE